MSTGLRELLETKLDTFEKLEVVIALRGTHPQTIPLDVLAARSGLTSELTTKAVSELAECALVALDRQGQVRLATKPDGTLLQELAEVYQRDRAGIALVLAEVGVQRVRTLAARTFIRRK